MDSSSDRAEEEEAAEPMDEMAPSWGDGTVPLVGLGGSAGAIPELQTFFKSVPADCGLAFVVVIHLGSGHESTLAELLQRSTAMPVVQLHGSVRVEPGKVYVIPPRKAIKAVDGHLVLSELPDHGRHVAVDLFFRTLADTHGAHAAAIILSGADGDGTSGIKRIKERGGLTIAQDPQQAEHGEMTRSAIATGMVDWVLPVAEMAARLLAYFRLEKTLKLPPEEGPQPAQPLVPMVDGDEALLREVLAFLRIRTGRDFSAYKRATIVRRIARRMQVNDTEQLQDYLNCLRTRPGEAGALLQDLLISVTNFFRDSACFAALEAQIGGLFKGKGASDMVRVWVPACATGEEAYSIAVLLAEKAREIDAPPKLQIFATDLDEAAIRTAREGVYPVTIEADVSQQRLSRYFYKEHLAYRVRREIREMVLFAPHDLLKDSPFSRLDLISCRNLLIYLNREAQQRVFQTFHFALLPHGRLFLGSSESLEEASVMFKVLDKKNRVFAQRPSPRPNLDGLSAAAGVLAPRTPGRSPDSPATVQDAGTGNGTAAAGKIGTGMGITTGPAAQLENRGNSWGQLHFKLLEALGPPSVLVNGEHEILHLSAHAGRFLRYGGGEPSTNLLLAVHPSLRIELRASFYQAAQSKLAAEVTASPVSLAGENLEVTIRVLPTQDIGDDLYLVTFDARPIGATAPVDGDASGVVRADPVARHLDDELQRLKSHLRDTVEQYEASTEELKASNEELQAMNEELRSATEELETSREELQSTNEELSTVNQELKTKLEELSHANSDIHNLMDATAIATVFLDRELRVTRYTPSAVTLFHLIPTDVGRPLADLSSHLDYPQLDDDARRVLERLTPIEREVGLPEGKSFLTRLLPYRTLDDHIGGVVLSFIDITERKKAEEVRRWLSAVVASTTDAIISCSADHTILSWNAGAEQIFGHSAAEAIGQPMSLFGADYAPEQVLHMNMALEGRSLANIETVRRRKGGAPVHVSLSISPIREDSGRVIGATAIARDISQARQAAEALRSSEERLRLVLENASEYAIFSTGLDRRMTSWNSGAQRLLGYTESEVLGRPADLIFTEEDRAAGVLEQETEAALADGRATGDRFHRRKDGSRFWASGATMLMRDATGQAVGFVKILHDQTADREAQQVLEKSQAELVQALQDNSKAREELELADVAKDRFLAVLSHELRNPLASIAGASELLIARELKKSDLDQATQVVRHQAQVMKALLDDLLDVSRLRLGRLTLRRETVSLGSVVEAALETTRPLIEAAGHQLTLQMPTGHIMLDADPLRLSQLVSNLVTNAVKYTPDGGRIGVSAELTEGEVVLTVTDSGIGLGTADIDRVFDLFSQAKEAIALSRGGLGIGLALARSIAALHGGWLRASSAGPGQGCQFRLGLPCLRNEPQPVPVASNVMAKSAPKTPAPDTAVARRAVLIADDNRDAAWGLSKLLGLAGFDTLLAQGGEEALRLAEAHRPAVMLLDIGMPDLGGHEVARRVRATAWGTDTVLIAATGWGQDADVRRSLAAGFDAHLTKPLDVGKLKALIDELTSPAAIARRSA